MIPLSHRVRIVRMPAGKREWGFGPMTRLSRRRRIMRMPAGKRGRVSRR